MLKFADNAEFYWNFFVCQRDQSLLIEKKQYFYLLKVIIVLKVLGNPLKF